MNKKDFTLEDVLKYLHCDYSDLISMLYCIGNLTEIDMNTIIDRLDAIITSNGEHI